MQKDPLRVVQISDSHLFADKSGCLLGMNTEESFQAVMSLAEKEQQDVALVLATGDISQDASEQAYRRFYERVQTLGAPVYSLPGNHDVLAAMSNVVPKKQMLSPTYVDIGGWRIILLDSALPGQVPGELSAEQLAYLDSTLQNSSDKHVMVSFHHHPVKLNSQWLDGVALKNPDPFWQIISAYKVVKTLVWGHVHQAYDQEHQGVRCFALPSTCVQFKPNSTEFAVDDAQPGYRWFDLYADGGIDSGVSRVQDRIFSVDLNGTGY